MPRLPVVATLVFGLASALAPHVAGAQATSDSSLVGLWTAKKYFGPYVRGRLVVDRRGGEWRAEIAGRSAPVRTAGDTVASGFMRGDVLSLFIEGRGGSYDFHRVPPDSFSDFYPRGRPSVRYSYEPPRARDDGWKVGTLEQVGLSRAKITELMQMLSDAASDSMNAYRLHGLLIARHGILVLEEYS